MLPQHIPQIILETPRLLLRELNPEIKKWLFDNHTNAELTNYFGMDEAGVSAERSKHQRGMSTYRMTYKTFQLISKETGTVLGYCGFHNWFAEHSRSEMGYHMLRDEYKGKGYTTEAFKTLVEYGFTHMNLNRLEACISPNNEPSLRVVKRLGFQQEGLLRQHYFKNGVLEDSAIFGLLKTEYVG